MPKEKRGKRGKSRKAFFGPIDSCDVALPRFIRINTAYDSISFLRLAFWDWRMIRESGQKPPPLCLVRSGQCRYRVERDPSIQHHEIEIMGYHRHGLSCGDLRTYLVTGFTSVFLFASANQAQRIRRERTRQMSWAKSCMPSDWV